MKPILIALALALGASPALAHYPTGGPGGHGASPPPAPPPPVFAPPQPKPPIVLPPFTPSDHHFTPH